MDNVLFPGRKIAFLNNYGDSISSDSIKSQTPQIVGTIAPDLFKNKILIIDYPNKRICVVDELPAFITQKADFVPVKIRKGRIKIPFTIGYEEHDIMFDTGAGIFPIYTSAENSGFFAGSAIPITDTIIGQSWGQKNAIYGKKISKEIKLNGKKMSPGLVYYKNDEGEKKFEDEENIIGLTGNAYFLNKMIIIDYKQKRFGVL